MRPAALLVLLVVATGCAIPTTAPRDLARARRADSLGHDWTALRVYRAAAHGGSLDAQMHLASPVYGARIDTWLGDLFDPRPTPSEIAMWGRTARVNATRRAANGDPDGHFALGLLTYAGPDLIWYSSDGDPPADTLALAHRHLHAALDAGSVRAAVLLGQFAWFGDRPLAAVPYFRTAARMGHDEAYTALASLALNRPRYEQGRRLRDGPPDTTDLDIVGEVRELRAAVRAGSPAGTEAYRSRMTSLRDAAAAGDADAVSMLGSLRAAGLAG